ncbi:hypothetical protein G5B88_09175 [Herbaspirillum seropedicae]|uniref:Signal peptide protein n=1 Tax=Herbaspirillum seropedicae (strain SmR1) TaxID=757424 RepID=D8IRK6_HERSS|nr:hypothetical protein [Herbaspirillum seropedicae]ADJ63330.1 signal peptide protein [Herbaspirillum seropedicae SmR1]AKN65368.1 hypothetical protein ACP92_09075 [Herbaspirillum seropedicae]NQE28531.1 hypothetical protein [Herbaspirillum seropedicae]UMU21337.1 hypothetical protein G5B88_09175 [Herbaspirillum seropedicae]
MKLALLICLAPLAPLAQAQIDIGFYRQERNGLSLYTTAPLNTIHTVMFCTDPSDGQSACHTLKPYDFTQAAEVDFVMAEQRVRHYRISKRILPHAKTEQGIAIINAQQVTQTANAFSVLAQRRRYKITTCTGSEGINLDLYDGPHKLRNLYFYLGYDITPTCDSASPSDKRPL